MKKITVLESLRGFASVYVAIGHFILSLKNVPSALNLLFRFGQEAVIIFFILSGFVIYYSSIKNKNENIRSYFIKRFRRIYFPLICALVVSVVFVARDFSIKSLIGNLLMLQDFETGKPGNLVSPFLGNAPLWSLSYEWTFYLLFPFVFAVIGNEKNRVHVVGLFSTLNLLAFILFPNHIILVFAYFLIWWTGLEIAEYSIGAGDKSKIKTLFIYYTIAIFLLVCVCLIDFKQGHSVKIGIYPFLVLRHFSFGCLCLLMTVYLRKLTRKLIGILKPFALIAPISYGIYILHYPILVQAKFNLTPFTELALKIGLVMGLSYLVEIVLQPRVNKLLK